MSITMKRIKCAANHDVFSSKRPNIKRQSRANVHNWQNLLLQPDISSCLALSKLRCIISIVSLVLLVTDIPRSGLGVRRLSDYYSAQVMPDIGTRFGPYAYPVRHIWRTSTNVRTDGDTFHGLDGTDPVDSASVWAYQYDTTSIGLRGAVDLFNVTDFPDYLLYRGRLGRTNNQNGILNLNTTFFMLDAFISAARTRLLSEGVTSSSNGFHFATKNNWVDRIHQYLTHFVKPRRFWSLHSIHVPRILQETTSLKICLAAKTANTISPPPFCNSPGTWKCEHPINASLPAVRIWDHIDLRFRDLRRQYPELVLDVVLLSTHRPLITSGTLSYTFFNSVEQEIVMLTRGRRCVMPQVDKCSTVFVDDYRYERGTLETNVVDWYIVIAMARAGAQNYFWVRLLLLYRTAFIAAAQLKADEHHRYSRIVSTVQIVLKVPFQVIVYSSPFPVACYVVALLLDGNFMDIFLDAYWSSLEGTTNFDIVPFFNSTVIQMRTVWLIALFISTIGFMTRKPRNGAETTVPGMRGLFISFTSALIVFGPYKQTSFRTSEIISVIRLPDIGQTTAIIQATPQWFFNESTYLFDDTMTMLSLCVAVVATVVSTAKVVAYLVGDDRELVLMTTQNVPCGTERLWPTSSLSIRFDTHSRSSPHQIEPWTHPSIIKIAPESMTLHPAIHTKGLEIPVSSCFFSIKSKKISTATTTEAPSGLRMRTIESHTILQLMNIAMMTDPWNFFWLRVIGIQLYLYRIQPSPLANSSNPASYAVILPYTEDEMEERMELTSDKFHLLDFANSRDVPMHILLQCG